MFQVYLNMFFFLELTFFLINYNSYISYSYNSYMFVQLVNLKTQFYLVSPYHSTKSTEAIKSGTFESL